MKNSPLSLLVVAALLAGCAPQSELKNPAPRFRGKSYDGNHYSLFDLTKGGHVVVVFLSPDDSEAPETIGQLRWLRQENPGLRVAALVQAEEAQLWAWCRDKEKAWEFDATVPILSDQFGEFIRKFGAKRSREFAVVAPTTEILAEGSTVVMAEQPIMKKLGLKGLPKLAKSEPPEFKF
ncbi:MAG: redoxin domain-containing protein [Chthonomonas sp.]|nr:redoxin domain-containing protein [Chthonomonas sp.]